jgi:hypothetical protein
MGLTDPFGRDTRSTPDSGVSTSEWKMSSSKQELALPNSCVAPSDPSLLLGTGNAARHTPDLHKWLFGVHVGVVILLSMHASSVAANVHLVRPRVQCLSEPALVRFRVRAETKCLMVLAARVHLCHLGYPHEPLKH